MRILLKTIRIPLLLSLFVAAAGTCSTAAAQDKRPDSKDATKFEAYLQKEVRHRLLMLPRFSVFDNLQYSISGYTVTLLGQVNTPSLKGDAEDAVKEIEGVEKVVNKIEILPPSPNDNRIRRAMYRAIYGFSQLQQYELRAVPPIHIIVKNGHVTLEGAVANQTDKDLAYLRASGVPGVFSVTNNLAVDK